MDENPGGRKIGITGANGFVGRFVVAEIARRGGVAVALVRAGPVAGAAETRIVGDIGDGTDWRPHVSDLDAVVHLAARVHVMADRAADPLAAFRAVNRDGSRKLAEDCAAVGVARLVFLSSIKVNGEGRADGRPYRETDPPAPRDPYGQSKLEAEEAIADVAADSALDHVILRPPLVYGPGVGGNLHRLMRLIRRGIPLPLGSVDNRRSLIGVRNLAHLVAHVLDHQAAANRVFLAGDGEDLSSPELVGMLARGLGVGPRLVPVPVAVLRALGAVTGKSQEVDRLVGSLQVDTTALRDVLGWIPPVPVEVGIQETAQAFLANRS